jgi:hypothetical protein
MFVNSIPIYWGSPLINLDFNTKSFVNLHDFKSDEEVICRIIELDQDKYKMVDLLNENWFTNNQLNQYCDRETLRLFFDKIFNQNITPVSSTFLGKFNLYLKNSKISLSRFKKKF